MVEHLDGHNDIVHKQLYSDWLPWSGSILLMFMIYVLRQFLKSLVSNSISNISYFAGE